MGRYGALSDYAPSRTIYNNGRKLYRLSFGGFDARGDANRMCQRLQRQGVECFVRARAGDSPVQFAARSGTGLAALG